MVKIMQWRAENEQREKTGSPGEYTLEAVCLVKAGQVAAVTAKVLGNPKQTLEKWVRLSE